MDINWEQIFSIFFSFVTFIAFLWKKWLKPIAKIVEDNNEIRNTLETIKKEVTTNGGKSIKDTINSLKNTCENIEVTQKIIEQRGKSSLHYNNYALFETDKEGHLVWVNEKFHEITGKTQSDLEGYDWISYIKSDERNGFLEEFSSCLRMCRKLEFITFNENNEKIKLVGYPYKVSDNTHGGFLIHISFLTGEQ